MDTTTNPPWLTAEMRSLGLLKFELLTSGIQISDQAKDYVRAAKRPLRTRSGSSGGLDIILPSNIHVNVPVDESFASQSVLVLDYLSNELVIRRGGDVLSPVVLQALPQYYSMHTSGGVPMVKVGQMCSGDRFCYGMTGPYCWFWKSERRCQYCSIGLNKTRDAARKTIEELLETLEQATSDPVIPARHILIGGGTTEGEDMGAILASNLCKAIKERFNISCYVMISAPLRNEYIDLLHDSGVDELGMNLEFYSDAAWEELIPGKNRYIGKKRYLEALDYAVSRFGPINTRSILIVGLEEPKYSIEGAEKLASMGVMPILSAFRPLAGTALENRHGFDYSTYWEVYLESHQRAANYGIPTGPTCVACQNNVLALPLSNNQYHLY